jgi:hypothetical protein
VALFIPDRSNCKAQEGKREGEVSRGEERAAGGVSPTSGRAVSNAPGNRPRPWAETGAEAKGLEASAPVRWGLVGIEEGPKGEPCGNGRP